MLHLIIAFAFRLIVSDADARALQEVAPEPIDIELARANVAGARIAALVVLTGYDEMPDYLLAMARRESFFRPDARTVEKNGLVSCGVMTPRPLPSCVDEGVVAGYIRGAIHLLEWVEATSDREGLPRLSRAQLGYAGGWALIRRCDRGPLYVDRNGAKIDLCLTPQRTAFWADRIYQARSKWRAAS